jgi:hypothetical protein
MRVAERQGVKMICQSANPLVREVFHTEWSAGVGITGSVHGNAIFAPSILQPEVSMQSVGPIVFRSPSLKSDNHTSGHVNRRNENSKKKKKAAP